MTDSRFWDLLREARGLSSASADPARLKAVLERHSSDEVAEFGRLFYSKLCDLNQWRLWAAGYVIAGGMSDDAFHYFRSWIVGKGQDVFEVAMTVPDNLGPYVDTEEVENELLEYVAVELLEARGLEDPRDLGGISPDDMPSGEAFDEETVTNLMPKLAAQFLGVIAAPPVQGTTPTGPPPRQGEQAPPVQQAQPSTTPPKPQNPFQKAWSAFLAGLAAIAKFIYPIFKVAKFGKIFITMGSMFISMWFYSLHYGWPFAVGFVICILIHEMGHVFAAALLGLPISMPVFIPGFGAMILAKRFPQAGWQAAVMGIGGPIFGTLAAFACWGLYGLSGSPMFLGLALMAFFMNLFNMIPVFPLDGGWIAGAVSPYIWVVGLGFMVFLEVVGVMSNPFIWVLIIMSLPRVFQAFKRGTVDSPAVQTTSAQRAIIGVSYVALATVLALGVAATGASSAEMREERLEQRQERGRTPLAFLEPAHTLNHLTNR